MSDESQLQVRPKDSDSLLSLLRVSSGLIARGLREAEAIERQAPEPIDPLSETRRLAEQGDADAQFDLGEAYYHGQVEPQDHSEAVRWYRKAAAQYHTYAQFKLGCMYEGGEGVPQDQGEAFHCYCDASDSAWDDFWLRDYAEAAKWYRKAAELGYGAAQYYLGFAYRYGEGVTQDDIEAAKWFRKAAEQGHAHAQYDLGRAYYRGEGVPQDHGEALKWYSRAGE
ncbi:MAG: tetratricopeptide repeat protein, partial [Terriglobales bacterium]